jgi:hypothetical protein
MKSKNKLTKAAANAVLKMLTDSKFQQAGVQVDAKSVSQLENLLENCFRNQMWEY